jgi:hypothetical protein
LVNFFFKHNCTKLKTRLHCVNVREFGLTHKHSAIIRIHLLQWSTVKTMQFHYCSHTLYLKYILKITVLRVRRATEHLNLRGKLQKYKWQPNLLHNFFKYYNTNTLNDVIAMCYMKLLKIYNFSQTHLLL